MAYMELTIKAIDAADMADTLAKYAALVGGTMAAPEAPAAVVEPKPAPKSRKNKAEETAVPLDLPSVDTAAEAVGSTETPNSDPAVAPDAPAEPANDDAATTYEDVRNAVVGLAAAKGRDAAIAVLDQFGVDHASKLTEAQWPEALAALNDAKAAG